MKPTEKTGNRGTHGFGSKPVGKSRMFWAAILMIGAGLLHSAQALDWPAWRGPDRDGASKEKDWLGEWSPAGPPVLWRASVGIALAGVTVADGGVYTIGWGDEADTVRRLAEDSGEEVWSHAYPAAIFSDNFQGPASTPTVSNGRVYGLSRRGDLFCLDAATGKPLWGCDVQAEFGVPHAPHGFSCSPLIEGDMMIMDIGKTIAFDKATGEVLWQTKDYGTSYSSAIAFDLAGHRCLAVFNASGLVILRLADGEEVCLQEWNMEGINNVNATVPIIDGDLIFINSTYEMGSGLIKIAYQGEAEVVYKKPMRAFHHFANYVLHKGDLYGIEEKTIHCLDFKTGEQRWAEAAELGKGALMLSEGKLVILSEAGELIIASATPTGYEEIRRVHVLGGTSWTPPVLANGRLYCRNGKGDLVCLAPRGGEAGAGE